jgi:hypothetical protein
MNLMERNARANSIIRRQKAGQITHSQASAEFDALLDATGDLHYYSDTTCMRANWGGEHVMVFPKELNGDRSVRNESNTGIITQGPRRGEIVTHPTGHTCTAHMSVVAHFSNLRAGGVVKK